MEGSSLIRIPLSVFSTERRLDMSGFINRSRKYYWPAPSAPTLSAAVSVSLLSCPHIPLVSCLDIIQDTAAQSGTFNSLFIDSALGLGSSFPLQLQRTTHTPAGMGETSIYCFIRSEGISMLALFESKKATSNSTYKFRIITRLTVEIKIRRA